MGSRVLVVFQARGSGSVSPSIQPGQVSLVHDMLRADLADAQPTGSDPATDGLRITSDTSGDLGQPSAYVSAFYRVRETASSAWRAPK